LLVEPDCEPTQSLCPCDHVISNATSYFAKALSWQPLLFQMILFFPKQQAKIYLEKKKFFQTIYL
jgi:hypothetical protein